MDRSIDPSTDPSSLALVKRALEGLCFGECVIAVHDGEIVQISRTEKLRPPTRRHGERSTPSTLADRSAGGSRSNP
ncbi:MAG: YezD family protein [Deltaproteobacteria bacterium]|nr:YezD family protein [Deltaproteobacteria bacterium]